MEETIAPERTIGRNGGTHASAVSKMLMGMGYIKFAQYDTTQGGYHCSNWGDDTEGGTLVKVEYRRPGRGLKGKPSEDTINRVRRAKLTEMAQGLRKVGYYVSWGWDETTGEPDTTFITVSVHPARGDDVVPTDADKSSEELQEDFPVSSDDQDAPETSSTSPAGLWAFLISIPQIEETVLDIARAHNAGKDEVARRLEHTLYQKVLLAIVGGVESDPRELAAAALATQHLSIPR